jgi:hypothetical protein
MFFSCSAHFQREKWIKRRWFKLILFLLFKHWTNERTVILTFSFAVFVFSFAFSVYLTVSACVCVSVNVCVECMFVCVTCGSVCCVCVFINKLKNATDRRSVHYGWQIFHLFSFWHRGKKGKWGATAKYFPWSGVETDKRQKAKINCSSGM